MKYIFPLYYIMATLFSLVTYAYSGNENLNSSTIQAVYGEEVITSSPYTQNKSKLNSSYAINSVVDNVYSGNFNSSNFNSVNSSLDSFVSIEEHNSISDDFGVLIPHTPCVLKKSSKLKINSNTNWSLSVQCTDFKNQSNEIPLERLSAKLSDDISFSRLSSSGLTLIKSQSKGIYNISIDYNLETLVIDPPGQNYIGFVTYTVYTF